MKNNLFIVKIIVVSDEPLPPPLFDIGERVLCFHGPLVYEGKTLKKDFKKEIKEYRYFIHYAGWSKSWDEWVIESRVLKYNDSNLERQKDLKIAHEEQTKGAKKLTTIPLKAVSSKKRSSTVGGSDTASVISASDSRSSTPILDQKGSTKSRKDSVKTDDASETATTAPSTSRKRKRSEYVEPETTFILKQEVHIPMPEQLSTYILDDWDHIIRQRRLLKLPARSTVSAILEDYLKSRKKNDYHVVELCNGLREYFDCMLGSQLLYRYEREQYQDVHKEIQDSKKQLSEIYGVQHLLRLFTKLGGCLSYTNLDAEAVSVLQSCVEEFLKFILKNENDLFSLDDYQVAEPEYQRQVPA